MLTKNAIGNIKNRYLAVLKKCRLMNVFGNLAIASNLALASTLAMAITAPLAIPRDALVETQVSMNDGYGGTTSYTAYTVVPDADTDYTITSSNAISKTNATGNYIGLYAVDSANTSANITIAKDGSISVSSPAGNTAFTALYGIYANRTTNAIINNGTITVLAQTENLTTPTASANAYGLFASGDNTVDFTNNGTITVSATAQIGETHARGIFIDSAGGTNDFTNNGIITVTAKSEGSSANAYGMLSSNTRSANTLTNNGSITAIAWSGGSSASACGMNATGTTNELTNYGSITVSATAEGEANARGMFVGEGSSILNNYGIITVSASSTSGTSSAYQAYVASGTASIGTWNLLLGEDYGTGGTGYYVFGVVGSAKMTFGTTDNSGSTFNVYGISTPSANGLYSIEDMVWAGGTDDVTGYIENVTSSYAFLDVALVDEFGKAYDLTTTNNDTWKDQYIKASVNVTTDNSPVHATMATTVSSLTSTMSQLSTILADNLSSPPTAGKPSLAGKVSTMYADAGNTVTTSTDAGYVPQDNAIWKTFLTPYYSRTSHNDGLYDVHGMGLAMGASRSVTEAIDLGFHFNLASSLGDSDLADSDSLSYTLGMHGIYHVDESLYVRGQVSGFMVESDLHLLSNEAGDLYADADMNSYGMYAQLVTGYHVALTPQHMLTPELAVSYMYAYMDGYDTEFRTATGGLGNALSMKSEDYDVFYADASLRWAGTFDVEKGVIKPTVKAGIRQALSDVEIASTMEIFGTKATTYSDANETAFTCEAGLD